MANSWVLSLRITNVLGRGSINLTAGNFSIRGDQPWDFFGGNDAEAETPVLWPPRVKS